jgi:hypothetical protein
MRVDAVPSISLEHVTALWADAWEIIFLFLLTAKARLAHGGFLRPPTFEFTGTARLYRAASGGMMGSASFHCGKEFRSTYLQRFRNMLV